MALKQMIFSGFGGQGVILSGMILGKAATLFANKYATLAQSYGPEARGGACSAQVIVSDKQILYPYVIQPDIMMLLSQEAFNIHAKPLPQGIIILEEDLVTIDKDIGQTPVFTIPATRIAEEVGRTLFLNIVMLGFFTAVTNLLPKESIQEAIRASVPRGTENLNIKALQTGFDYFQG
jgi:2-oxoglutarate ferredoxin oxidoreductase subunit gamma